VLNAEWHWPLCSDGHNDICQELSVVFELRLYATQGCGITQNQQLMSHIAVTSQQYHLDSLLAKFDWQRSGAEFVIA